MSKTAKVVLLLTICPSVLLRNCRYLGNVMFSPTPFLSSSQQFVLPSLLPPWQWRPISFHWSPRCAGTKRPNRVQIGEKPEPEEKGGNSLRELTKPSHRRDIVKLKKTYHHNQKKLRQITKVNHFKGDQTSKPIIHHLLTLNPIPFNLSLPLCLFLSFPHQPGQCLIT